MVDNTTTLFNCFFRDFRDFRDFGGFDLADNSKCTKLSKVTSFCSSQIYLFPVCFSIFYWLNVVKRSSNGKLNSWMKEKFSTSMKFNPEHYISIWKLTSKIHRFFPVWSLPQSYHHWLYFTFFILLLEMHHFSD